ncbi:MAG: peptide ABC transporter substrate-binding protein, partial [Candidatus Eremiobacteraeota bacterium]|nr:peptide ABC transporter substrate-binding protein [Candidatus Eremiobacteraeota bacterium]
MRRFDIRVDVARAAASCTLAILCACSAGTSRGWHRGADTLNAGAAIEPNSFNPLLVTESIENDIDRMIFNGLTLVDDKNTIQPDLATVVPSKANGGISADGKTVTYHLRRGVQWQDGAPFTSADVKFSWQAIMNANTRTGNRVPYDEIARVDTPDAYTVIFHLKRPYAPFIA